MTPRWILIGILGVLAAVVALAFADPHRMVSPGDLRPAHASMQQDCFACHTPFAGVSSEKCVGCHAIADIGRVTTKGAPLDRRSHMPPFHQLLARQDCMACHTDHPRPRLTRNLAQPFDHAMLAADARARCSACHQPPADALHRGADLPCAQCHGVKAWKPAAFEHTQFSLASPHDTACATCHVGGNYKAYTCYGCHEHQKGRIEAEHREHGIRDIDNCVRCHRGADGEHGEGREGTERGEGREGGDD